MSSAPTHAMAKLVMCILLSILASVYTQCTINRAQPYFKRSIYDFTVKLARRISLDTESHFIASGLSPWLLLSTASLGATEETLSEIAYVLRMHPNKCFRDKYNELARKVTTITNGTTLERSATILVDRRLDLNTDFRSDVMKAGVCNIEVLSFDDSIYTAAYVNDLVSKATHEAIDEIVTPNDIEGASMLIVDAMYFKGAWKNMFPFENTRIETFHNHKGEEIGEVNMMHVKGVFNVTRVKQINAMVLELPYGEENRFSMLIVLPNTDVPMNNVIDDLKNISLRTVFALFAQLEPDTVVVNIPRFKISSDINNLKELLMDMGLRKMFDSGEAQFDAMVTNADLFVSNLIQKAELEVTEDGTTAAVATEMGFQDRMMPNQFIANRPFAFMIVDRDTEIPLFIGAYSLPNLF